MTKSRKVREVYTELKGIYGDGMSSRELLECASLIVEASEDSIYEPKTYLGNGGIPFSELPVDQVIERFPWKVLNREMIWEDDYSGHISKQQLINQCLDMAA